jgi:hypothetical protein
LEHWALPIGITSSNPPNCKIETNICLYSPPFQFLCMGVEFWGVIGNVLENTFGNLIGTTWEHGENTLGTRGKNQRIPLPPTPPNWTVH